MRKKEFIESLSAKQIGVIKTWIDPNQDRVKYKLNDPDHQQIERLIFATIVRLGWKPELFAELDNNINSHNREAKKSERIGKKYQWIAFHEVLARIADNFAFKSSWSDEIMDYKGVWQFSDRDIDPSILLDEGSESKPVEKYHISYSNWRPQLNPTDWMRIRNDLLPQTKMLQMKDNNGKNWLILDRWYSWEQPSVPGLDKYDKLQRTLWYFSHAYIIPQKDAHSFYTWAKKQDFMGRWMPEGTDLHQIYLQEFPNHLAYKDEYLVKNKKYRWREVRNGKRNDDKTRFKVLPTYENYSGGLNGFDCSTDNSNNLTLPSKEIYDLLGLDVSNEDGVFTQGNEVTAYDSQTKGEARGLIVDKEKLLKTLVKNDLALFWVIIGEKQTLGGSGNYFGRLEMGGIHWLKNDGKIVSEIYDKYTPPEEPKPKKNQ